MQSLRAEIYKGHLLSSETPRSGDVAAVVRNHCVPESGAIVRVVGDPHRCQASCQHCGITTTEWMVEVQTDLYEPEGGPYYLPLAWLRRVLPLGRRH